MQYIMYPPTLFYYSFSQYTTDVIILKINENPIFAYPILGFHISLDTPWIFSPHFSVVEHWATNQTPILISLDQQTSSPAIFLYDTVQVKSIHLRLHRLTHNNNNNNNIYL